MRKTKEILFTEIKLSFKFFILKNSRTWVCKMMGWWTSEKKTFWDLVSRQENTAMLGREGRKWVPRTQQQCEARIEPMGRGLRQTSLQKEDVARGTSPLLLTHWEGRAAHTCRCRLIADKSSGLHAEKQSTQCTAAAGNLFGLNSHLSGDLEFKERVG